MGDSFGGRQASPPTLDTDQSQKLTQADYNLKQKNTPGLVETTGKAGREEYARNIAFALRGFTNPSSIFQGEIEDLRQGRSKTQKSLEAMDAWQTSGDKRYDPTAKKWITADEYTKQRAGLQSKVDRSTRQIQRLRKSDPVKNLQRAFRSEFKMRDNLLGDMRSAEKSTEEYRAMQRALKAGTDAQEVGIRSADLSQVGAGALGDALMSRAMERAASDGRLSAEANRDAVQSARQGMAARGMATGSAGLAAELLNRDRYSRSRMAEDLAFAQGIQNQDLTRQLANMEAANNMAQYNTTLAANTDQFNAAQRTDTDRFNLGLLQTSATAADNERARQLGLGQTAYNFALQTNPKLMLAGLGSPYANFTPQALGLMNNTNVQPIYSGGQLGSPGVFQTVMGTVGQVAQAGGQAYAASASDRRMKKDIKPVGKDGVLGLKTYEYRFKGESKDAPKHIGYMAQEVRKVLPEAVEEFNYRGKKRLAIKPAVIGQALTEALAEQQRNMFADGYVVGSGFGG